MKKPVNEAAPKTPTKKVRDALVAMKLKEDTQIEVYDQIIGLLDELDGTFGTKEDGELFMVYASSGRMNGWAWVRAKSKAHAKQIAKNDWLENGKVDEVMTEEEYKESEMYDEDDEVPTLKLGEYEEMEWGS